MLGKGENMSGPNNFERDMIKSLSRGFNGVDCHIMSVRFYDPNDDSIHKPIERVAKRFGCTFDIGGSDNFGVSRLVFKKNDCVCK